MENNIENINGTSIYNHDNSINCNVNDFNNGSENGFYNNNESNTFDNNDSFKYEDDFDNEMALPMAGAMRITKYVMTMAIFCK